MASDPDHTADRSRIVADIKDILLDPDFLTAVAHPARLQALCILEDRAASSREIAVEVELSHSATAYHVRKLSEAGLIVAVETRKRRAFEETVWKSRTGGWKKLSRLLMETSGQKPAR